MDYVNIDPKAPAYDRTNISGARVLDGEDQGIILSCVSFNFIK